MKRIHYILSLVISLTVYVLILSRDGTSQQSNFQIAPSPIAYPYFEEGRFDGTVDATFISMSMTNFSMAGGDLGGRGRAALSDFFAIDGTLGMTFLGGNMKPGLVPISYYDPFWIAIPGDEATLSFFSMRGSINLEIQPIHTPEFDIILFGGPQFMFSNYTITSDYSLFNGVTYATGYEDKLTIISTMSGLQMGIQVDINLGSEIRLSPFFMMTTSSGSATMTDDPQLEGYDPVSYDVDIPSTTSTSLGMDIIFEDISIGTVLQQMKKTDETSEDTRIIMISISYHFSSGKNSTEDQPGTGTDEVKM